MPKYPGLDENGVDQDGKSTYNPTLLKAYQEMIKPGAKESDTTQFYNYLFTAHIFPPLNGYLVAPESPPIGDSRRKIDLSIKYFHGTRLTILCFVEAKKYDPDPNQIDVVELQAWTACVTLCDNTAQDFVYAMTVAGPYIRLWKYYNTAENRETRTLEPMFGTKVYGDTSQYISLAGENGSDLKEYFDLMIRIKPRQMTEW